MLDKFFGNEKAIVIKQVREMFEIIINWETANKYELRNAEGKKIGFVAERSYGIFHKIIRNLLRAHRPITVDIWNDSEDLIMTAERPFHFFFSELSIKGSNDELLGEVKTRFGVLKRKYDLINAQGQVFARIESPRWRIWTFPIFDRMGQKKGVVTKEWSGFLKEFFTDADILALDLSQNEWNLHEKAVLLGTTVMIDLDFFEDNSGSVFDLLPFD